ncbi:MAG: amino-acid N-acetyltransferase [Hydrogenophilus sp.]|nr:amino-acid N-acetyltransferase [Hydrogenophilus sp.]
MGERGVQRRMVRGETPEAVVPLALEDPNAVAQFVAWLRHAAPYIHAFGGKTFVVAFDGEVAEGERMERLAYDCNLLAALGVRLVLVHGARPQIDAEMRRRGLTPVFHRGLRVTDAAALECVKAAQMVTRLEVEAKLSLGLPNTPMAGSFMRVTGGNFLVARPLGVIDGVDFQYTGAVRKVIAEEIVADLEQENVVLISPLAPSPSGELFNLNMEEVAAEVAVAVEAEKLIFLCDAVGLPTVDGRGIVSAMTVAEAEHRLAAEGTLWSEDLRAYLPYAVDAVKRGVNRAHLIPRDLDGAILLECFTHAGVGTMITRDPVFRFREARSEDIAALLALIAPLEADGTLVRRSRELLEQEIDRFVLAEHDGVVVGSAALYPFAEEQAGELACLAVAPDFRCAGIGEELLRRIEARARAAGLSRLYVLTTRTAHWFLERGFVEVGVEALPQRKQALYNYQRRSKVLVKILS